MMKLYLDSAYVSFAAVGPIEPGLGCEPQIGAPTHFSAGRLTRHGTAPLFSVQTGWITTRIFSVVLKILHLDDEIAMYRTARTEGNRRV